MEDKNLRNRKINWVRFYFIFSKKKISDEKINDVMSQLLRSKSPSNNMIFSKNKNKLMDQ